MREIRRLLTLVVVLAIGSGVLTSTALVFAQDETPEAGVAAITPVASTDQSGTNQVEQVGDGQPPVFLVTDDPTAIKLDQTAATLIVGALLVIVVVALWQLIEYLNRSQRSYYRLVREFGRKGIFFAPSYVSATAPVSTQLAAEVTEDGEPAPPTTVEQQFRVRGPGITMAGEAATFSAFLDDIPAEGTTWQLVRPDGTAIPAGAATIQPEVGPSTTFTSSTPGQQYQLNVTPPGGTGALVQTSILVIEAPSQDAAIPSLPFVGQGYGSIVGGLVLMALVGALAAIRAIDADIIGVLLGSLAGFFFGVNAAAKA